VIMRIAVMMDPTSCSIWMIVIMDLLYSSFMMGTIDHTTPMMSMIILIRL